MGRNIKATGVWLCLVLSLCARVSYAKGHGRDVKQKGNAVKVSNFMHVLLCNTAKLNYLIHCKKASRLLKSKNNNKL